MAALEALLRRRLLVVTGKGGAGKTTLTALLGRLLAARGRRVLLLEALVREKVPLAYVARKITQSAAFRQFVAGAPGLKETALLGFAFRALQGPRLRADLVIIDAPATGHGATLLAAPGLLARAAGDGQLGEMASALAAFLADAAQTGIVLATLAEEMPVQETLELIALLRDGLGLRPDLIVANGLYPGPPRSVGKDPGSQLWRARRRMTRALTLSTSRSARRASSGWRC